MTGRERIHALLAGEIPDRIGRAEAPWPETRARWRGEGLPANVHANDHFRMDIRRMITLDPSFRLAETVAEQTDEYRIVRTPNGVLTKFWTHTGIPQPIEYAVNSAQDWHRLRERLAASKDRIAFGYYGDYACEYTREPYDAVQAAYRDWGHRDRTFLLCSIIGPYESVKEQIGEQRSLLMFLTEPKLLAEMFDAHAALAIEMLDLVMAAGFRPDAIFLAGDMAYKNGMMFSPAMYRELLMPRDRAIIQHAKREHGLQVIYHCDGNCTEALPLLIEAGIDCIEPMEVAAGMDVRPLAEQFGDRIAFMGNLGVMQLSGDRAAVRREVAPKVSAMAEGRYRYIAHSDHSLPDAVSLANFRQVMEILDQLGTY